jgi:hypothetical protein
MWNVTVVMLISLIVERYVDKLQNEWSSRDNATTSGKKISADDIFENGGLAR